MKKKLRREVVSLTQSENSSYYTGQIGKVVYIILASEKYRLFRVASVMAWIQMPIILRQIQFFYDNSGAPIGYITWAYLAPDVEARVLSNPNFLLHNSEWNEGDHLWIMDFCAPKMMMREIVSYIRRNMFSEFDELRYVRRDASGTVRKICNWRWRRPHTQLAAEGESC